MPQADRIRFDIGVLGQADRAQRRKFECEWVEVILVGEILAREYRRGTQLHEQPVYSSQMLHLLDDDAHERHRIRRRTPDDFCVGGLECIGTVEVLDHEVLLDLGGFLQEPYEFEIGVGEIPLYRRKPVSLGQSPAGACDDSKHGDTAQQCAARDVLAFHVRLFP